MSDDYGGSLDDAAFLSIDLSQVNGGSATKKRLVVINPYARTNSDVKKKKTTTTSFGADSVWCGLCVFVGEPRVVRRVSRQKCGGGRLWWVDPGTS